MIKGITTNSPWIAIQNGHASNYINNYSGAQGVGNMRFNTTNQTIEVYDGNTWQTLGMGYAQIDLNPEAQQLLEWAKQQRTRQMTRESRARAHPSLRRALEAIHRAEENFDLLEKFVEHDTDESQPVQTSP